MTKIDVISGFLGAGKTTLIKKLLNEAIKDKVVLIENEFGEIGVDGSFLKDSGVEIKEINSGCICCSLVGDFEKSLKEVIDTYQPERIIIEPSGVGKLSEIIEAINDANLELKINSLTTVVDGSKCKMYVKNFGEFFNDQIIAATTVIISRADKLNDEKLEDAVDIIRQINPSAHIITTPIKDLSGDVILDVMENNFKSFEEELKHEMEHHHHDEEECCCGHHHEHHHHDEEECCCGHHHEHHHHDEEECCCGHHHEHHHHDEEECCCGHHHEHHHHHDGECGCGCGHHHHGLDADDVFTSIGIETIKEFTKEDIEAILKKLTSNEYGTVLRSKGVLKSTDNWVHFDITVDEIEIRKGQPDYTGRVCVIGSNLDEDAIKQLFK